MRILIIEDEKLTADDLVFSIEEVRPNFTVINILTSVKSAIIFLKTKPAIDLISSDIQLTDGLSFEIFKAIEIDVPIIFCTAYDEYALNAFNVNGIAYLLKPFTIDAIKTAIEKFENLTQQKDNKLTKLLQYMEQSNKPKASPTILVYQGEKIIPVPFSDIALIYLKNGIVKLHTFENFEFVHGIVSIEKNERISDFAKYFYQGYLALISYFNSVMK